MIRRNFCYAGGLMGKNSKRRDCPGLGRVIDRAECGAGRHSKIACPPTCAHNLFAPANYDALLEAETRLDRLTVAALEHELGESAVRKIIDEGRRRDGDAGANSAMVRALFFRRDADGRSFAERWLAAGAPGLDNDERVFFAGKARMRPVLLEIVEVRADGLLRARDLLEPEAGERLVLDRSAWARATRFQVLCVWAYPLPHFLRLCGGGVIWPEWRGLEVSPVEALAELVAHAGGPALEAATAARLEWVAEHFEALQRQVHAVTLVRDRDMLENIDASHGWAEYTLPATLSGDMDGRLAAHADVYQAQLEKPDRDAGFTHAYDWCKPSSPEDLPGRRELLGRVLRRGDTWRLEATGRSKLERLKAAFAETTGEPARQAEKEIRQELGRQRADKLPEADEALVPPSLRRDPQMVDMKSFLLLKPEAVAASATPEEVARDTLAAGSRRWLDSPIPALDGATPREASRDRHGRDWLVRMLKAQIHECDEATLRGKWLPDPMVLVRELGLTELDVPAPPSRPVPACLAEEVAAACRSGDAGTGPAEAPVYRPGVLPESEVVDRLLLVERRYPTDTELVDDWASACPDLADIVEDICLEIDERDMYVAVVEAGVALAWAILGGAATGRTLRMDDARLRFGFDDAWDRLNADGTTEHIVARMGAMWPSQPAITSFILLRLINDSQRRGEPSGTVIEPLIALAAWLDAAGPELERELGRRG